MYSYAIDVKYIAGYELEVTFESGEKGTVDLKGFVRKSGVFSRFSDMDYFKKVFVHKELGVLCWPGDVDIAPETIYSMATGKPLPDYLSPETKSS